MNYGNGNVITSFMLSTVNPPTVNYGILNSTINWGYTILYDSNIDFKLGTE